MHRLQIQLPPDVYEKLREEAHQKRVSMSQLVKDALIEKFKKEELIVEGKPLREHRQKKEDTNG